MTWRLNPFLVRVCPETLEIYGRTWFDKGLNPFLVRVCPETFTELDLTAFKRGLNPFLVRVCPETERTRKFKTEKSVLIPF